MTFIMTCSVQRLGLVEYDDALATQQRLVQECRDGGDGQNSKAAVGQIWQSVRDLSEGTRD